MGFTDIFKIKNFKTTIDEQKNKIQELENLLTPELRDVLKADELLKNKQQEIQNINIEIATKQAELRTIIKQHEDEIILLNNEISKKKDSIIILDNQILLQEFGLYTPIYNFITSEEYKNRLEIIRIKQKDMIKNDTAATYSEPFQKKWTRKSLKKRNES